MSASGLGQTRLTNYLIWNDSPTWSPNNSKIAWVLSSSDSNGLYVMNGDGSDQKNLTPNKVPASPTWSPDGQRIAFSMVAQTNGFSGTQVFVVNVDGTGLTRLTLAAESSYAPRWSPEGSRIVYVHVPSSVGDIFVMNADGTGQTNLSNNPATDVEPTWSPDGTRIAFVSYRDGNNGEIYTINVDGTGLTRLTNNPGDDRLPKWSPDGTRIAFFRNPGIYVMGVDGSSQKYLVGSTSDYSWSPDGHRIASSIEVDGNTDIYSVDVDGVGGVKRLTHDPEADVRVAWAPQ